MVDGRQYWMEQPTKALRPKPARPVVKRPSLDEVVEALAVEEFRNPEVTGRGVDRTRGLEIKHKSVGSPGLSRYDAQLTPVKKDNRFVKNLKDAAKVPSAINDAYQAVVDYQFPDMFTSPTHPDVPVGQALTGFKNLFLPMQLGDVGVEGGAGMIPIVMPNNLRGPVGNALSKLSGGKKRPNIPIKKEPKQIPTLKTARTDLTEEGFDNFHYNDYRNKFATGDLDNLGPMEKVVKDFSERDPELWRSFVRDVAEMDPDDPFVITDFVENYMNTVTGGTHGITGISVLPSHNFIDTYRRTAAELPELFRVDPETLHIIYSPDPNWVRSIDAGLPAQKGYFRPPPTPIMRRPETELGSYYGRMADESGFTKLVAGDDPDKVQRFYDALDWKAGIKPMQDFGTGINIHAMYRDILEFSTGSRATPEFNWARTLERYKPNQHGKYTPRDPETGLEEDVLRRRVNPDDNLDN